MAMPSVVAGYGRLQLGIDLSENVGRQVGLRVVGRRRDSWFEFEQSAVKMLIANSSASTEQLIKGGASSLG